MRNREQTVVHFAGGGGSCTGAEEALGESPDHAINHDAAALDPQQPLGTVVSGGGKHALAAASLVKLRGTNVGDKADAPMHTASAGGNHHGIVAAYLAQHNGGFNAVDGRGADEPVSPHWARSLRDQCAASEKRKRAACSTGSSTTGFPS